jgi:hypothetical protein
MPERPDGVGPLIIGEQEQDVRALLCAEGR